MSTILTIRHSTGSLAGKSQQIALQEGQTLRLGRDPQSDLKFSDTQDDSVSTSHAELSFQAGRLFIEDKRSSNGTFLNGAPCPPFQKVAVPDGAILRLAKQGPEMQLSLVAAPQTAQPVAPPPKESVGRATMLGEIDRARKEERSVVAGEIAKARKSTGLWVGLGLIAVLLLTATGIGTAAWSNHRKSEGIRLALEKTKTDIASAREAEKNRWARIESEVSPAVVLIRCQVRLVESCGGTGVLVSPGLILTARQNMAWTSNRSTPDYESLNVQFPGQQPINATLVATSSEHDLALLQVPVTNARTVPLGGSNADIINTADIAVIGYPSTLGRYDRKVRDAGDVRARYARVTNIVPTVVTGEISQSLTVTGTASTADYLHFNASTDRGNAGGPLLNDQGKLIGIVSRPTEWTGTQETMHEGNQAVPIDDIKKFLQDHRLQ